MKWEHIETLRAFIIEMEDEFRDYLEDNIATNPDTFAGEIVDGLSELMDDLI
jgi:hypothetical protein